MKIHSENYVLGPNIFVRHHQNEPVKSPEFVQGIWAVQFRETVKQPITLSRFKFKFTTHFSTERGPSEVVEGLRTLESNLNLNLDPPTNLLAVQTSGKLLLFPSISFTCLGGLCVRFKWGDGYKALCTWQSPSSQQVRPWVFLHTCAPLQRPISEERSVENSKTYRSMKDWSF